MEMKYIFYNTLKQIQCRKRSFVFSLLLILVAFLVIGYQFIVVGTVYYQRITMEKMLTEKCKNTFLLNLSKYKMFNSEVSEKMFELYTRIDKINGVKYAGIYVDDYLNGDNAMYVSDMLLPLCDLKDIDGKKVSFSYVGDENPVYVGFGLKEKYSIGDCFTDEGKKYVVKGVLQRGSRWIENNAYFAELYVDLDVCILADADKNYQNGKIMYSGLDDICYVIEKQQDSVKIQNEIFEIADNLELDLYSIFSLSERLDMNKRELFEDPVIFIMSIGMLILAMVSVVVSSVISIFLRKSSIGIMYAIGYSINDVKKMVVFENIIKISIPFLVSYCFWSMNEKNIYYKDVSVLHTITPWLLLGVFAIIVLSSWIPMKQLSKMYPAKLIGGKD